MPHQSGTTLAWCGKASAAPAQCALPQITPLDLRKRSMTCKAAASAASHHRHVACPDRPNLGVMPLQVTLTNTSMGLVANQQSYTIPGAADPLAAYTMPTIATTPTR